MSSYFNSVRKMFALENFKYVIMAVLVFCIAATIFVVPVNAETEDDYIPQKELRGTDVISDDKNDMIVYPHFGTPVFAEPGMTFRMEFAIPEDLPGTGWTAWVENDLKRWFVEINNVEKGENNIYLGMRDGYTADITLPADIPPELFTLVIEHESGKKLRSVASVSVVPELDSNFYIISTTDTHLVAYDENREDGALQGKTLGMMAQVATLAGARFFSHTGDVSLSHNESRAVSIRDFFIDPVVRMGRVPLIFANGNHEYDTYVTPKPSLDSGLRLGEFHYDDNDRYFGMRSQIINMGSFLVAKHDFSGYWFDYELRNALTAKWNNQSESVKYRLVLQHTHNGHTALFHEQSSEEIYPYPDLMIKGHDHQWRKTNPSSAYPFTIISLGGGAKRLNGEELPPLVEPYWVWGDSSIFDFRIDENGNWSCPSAETWTPSTGRFQLIEDARIGMERNKLRDSYVYDNTTGTATENLCTITNNLNFNFYDGRVRFLMEKGTYEVNGGEILAQYDYKDENGVHTAVLVKVNIPALGTTHVQIFEAGSEPTIPIPEPPEVKTAWEFTEDLEGWYAQDNNHIDELVWQEGGYIGGNALDRDPMINSPDNLGIDLDQYKIIKIRMKNMTTGNRAKIYFTTYESTSISEDKAVTFTLIPNDENYTEYVIDMSSHPQWKGILKKIRFDPIDVRNETHTGPFSIDYIRIQKVPAEPSVPSIELVGNTKVGAPGEFYNLTVKANSVTNNVYSAEITIDFSTDMFALKEISAANENIQIAAVDTNTPGKIRVILALIDGVENTAELINVRFQVRNLDRTATGIIAVSEARFGTAPDGDIIEATLSQIEVSYTTMDLNGNGKIDVGDLAIAVYHYQKNPLSSDWDIAKIADVNADDVVDIEDIAMIANAIIDAD